VPIGWLVTTINKIEGYPQGIHCYQGYLRLKLTGNWDRPSVLPFRRTEKQNLQITRAGPSGTDDALEILMPLLPPVIPSNPDWFAHGLWARKATIFGSLTLISLLIR
jgi:hypothetical protein